VSPRAVVILLVRAQQLPQMALERIFRWRRTLPLPDPSSGSGAFYRSRSSADSTITMSGSNFR
jgi:hypothetical protein